MSESGRILESPAIGDAETTLSKLLAHNLADGKIRIIRRSANKGHFLVGCVIKYFNLATAISAMARPFILDRAPKSNGFIRSGEGVEPHDVWPGHQQ